MNISLDYTYIYQVLGHIAVGVLMFAFPPLRQPFFIGVSLFFLIGIITAAPDRKALLVLLACAYFVGAECLFRMTNAGFFYENSKYFVILFCLMGLFYKGASGNGYPYFIYLILLLPAVLMAAIHLNFDLKFRSSVAFVLSGPVCLGISALFCYDKRFTRQQLMEVVLYLSLPIIAMTTYLFLYSPSIKDTLQGTASNAAASGGFGPNQVSSILGLGIVALAARLILKSPTLPLKLINSFLLVLISYRALITFSRGGVFAALIVIAAFLVTLYWRSSFRIKRHILTSLFLLFIIGSITWFYSSIQTEGFIDKRYANENAAGIKKEDVSTGRVDLFLGELEGFLQHPFLGVGASGMKQERLETTGRITASHNELSRLLSEHGLFGVFILIILILKPLTYRLTHKGNYFFYAFLCFWFATINHSAMRIAAPGFIYALTLIHIIDERHSVHRKSLKPPSKQPGL